MLRACVTIATVEDMAPCVLIYISEHLLSSDGYNKWRDAKKPTTILAELCRSNSIEPPEYRTSEVKVLNKIFKIPPDAVPEGKGQAAVQVNYCCCYRLGVRGERRRGRRDR